MARTRDRIAAIGLALGLAWGLATLVAVSARPAGAAPLADAVDSVTITVSDMERALTFYQDVLAFEKVSDVEVTGDGYERLLGVFGLRARVARLGEEFIELMAVLTPRGRPIPAHSRSNDAWFQHVAIVVADMDQAYAHLRRHRVRHTSPAPSGCPTGTRTPAGSRLSTSRIPTATTWRSSDSRPARAIPGGSGSRTSCSSASTIPRSWSRTQVPAAPSGRALWASRSRARARTSGPSRSGSTTSSARGCGSRRCVRPRAPGSSCWSTSRRAAGGRSRPTPAPPTCGTGRINLAVRDVAAAADHARERLISPGPVALPDQALGFARGLLARDPDGHAVLFTAGGQPAAED